MKYQYVISEGVVEAYPKNSITKYSTELEKSSPINNIEDAYKWILEVEGY